MSLSTSLTNKMLSVVAHVPNGDTQGSKDHVMG